MNGRSLFLAGILGLAAAAALLRYAHSPAATAPAVFTLHAAAMGMPLPKRDLTFADRSAPHAQALVVVYVAGEVLRPGVYRLAASDRAEAALRAAGGPTAKADLVAVNLAEPLRDGEEIAVPVLGAEEDAPRASSKRRSRKHGRTSGARKGETPQPLALNTADEEQLQTLPGVGPSLAARIVAYRRLNGSFAMLDDLLDVNGMTDAKIQRLAPYLIVP
jgi:competence protein ComEA